MLINDLSIFNLNKANRNKTSNGKMFPSFSFYKIVLSKQNSQQTIIIYTLHCLNSYQVNIDIEDVNDNFPEFESNTVRISVPENVELNTPLYAAHAHDKDSGKNGIVTYRLNNIGSGTMATPQQISSLFSIDARSGHLTLSRHLDYESIQQHSLIVTASDSGEPSLSSNLTIVIGKLINLLFAFIHSHT